MILHRVKERDVTDFFKFKKSWCKFVAGLKNKSCA
jgi:hypothetical protein